MATSEWWLIALWLALVAGFVLVQAYSGVTIF